MKMLTGFKYSRSASRLKKCEIQVLELLELTHGVSAVR